MTKLKPVLFLICKEEALLSRWIEKNYPKVEERSLLRGRDVSWKRLYEEGKAFSLFSPRRLIVVREAKDIGKEGEDLFLGYLSAPNPNVFFLLVDETLPLEGKVFKALSQRKLYAELKKPVGKGLYKWIEEEVERFGKRIKEDAVALLAERFSEDLEVLRSEIDKVVLYVGDKDLITIEDIYAVMSSFVEGSPFELLDSLFTGDGFRFVRGLERSFILKEPPVKVLSMLGKYIRMMLFLASDPSLETEVLKDLHPFFASKVKKGAFSHAPDLLSLSYKRLSLADDMIKRGKGNPYDLILWAVSPIFKREGFLAQEEP